MLGRSSSERLAEHSLSSLLLARCPCLDWDVVQEKGTQKFNCRLSALEHAIIA